MLNEDFIGHEWNGPSRSLEGQEDGERVLSKLLSNILPAETEKKEVWTIVAVTRVVLFQRQG